MAIHTLNGGTRTTTDYTNNDYTVWFNGTSSACPHVAGVAALILSVNPALTGQQVRDIIEQTAQKIGGYNYATTTGRANGTWHNEMGYGLINALCAVTRAQMSLATLSGPSLVCSSGTQFTVNNPGGATVSWTCSGNVTFDHQTGNNKIFTATGNGTGTIQAILITGCGNVPLPAKTVWAGVPVVSSLTGTSPIGVYQPANYYLGISDYASSPDSYSWGTSPLPGVSITSYGNYASIMFTQSGYYQVVGKAHNVCGWSDYGMKMVTVISGYKLSISPNPSTSETTLSLVSDTNESVQLTTDWDLDIYDSFQGLKEKKTKLKTSETKINTSSWKEGVYVIRATIGDKVVTEKLLVKH